MAAGASQFGRHTAGGCMHTSTRHWFVWSSGEDPMRGMGPAKEGPSDDLF